MQQTYFIFLLLDVLSENLKLFFVLWAIWKNAMAPLPNEFKVLSIIEHWINNDLMEGQPHTKFACLF